MRPVKDLPPLLSELSRTAAASHTLALPDADRPASYLACSEIAGLQIGLHVIGRVARARTEAQKRAMVWVHNYARILQISADMLSEQLGLARREINEALSHPACPHIGKFVDAQQRLRASFEASLPKLVPTRVTRKVRDGMQEAAEDRVLSEIIGPERVGKSEAFEDGYLRNWMDQGILISCPQSRDMHAFIARIALAMGIQVRSGKGTGRIADQIFATLATGVIGLICIDEGQNLWPSNIETQRPERLEFLRDAWDVGEINRRARRGIDGGGGLGLAICATPQFSDAMNLAIQTAGRWKPGQLEGRMRRSHTPYTLTKDEVTRIAKFHAPDFPANAIATLVDLTLASTGLLGFLVNVIGKVRFEAKSKGVMINEGLVNLCARKMLRGTLIERQGNEARKKAGLPPQAPPDDAEEGAQ